MASQGAASAPASRAKRPTIRDVATEAGVSKSLVSLVYSGGGVSEERRERVLAAAERLGFRPNLTARSLAAAEGDFTGILVADLHNPVFAEVVDAARAELARTGRSALLTAATTPDAHGEPVVDRRALAVFGDLRPRSILVVGSVPDMGELASIAPRTPVVVASAASGGLQVAATVRSDDGSGMRLVVDHLLAGGHARIAHIGGRGGVVAEQRAAAYAAAMRERGLAAETRVAPSGFSEHAGYAAAMELLADPAPPTAITCLNDQSAVGALAAAADSDVRVAVTGYDNSLLAQLRQVSLTSVDPDNAEIGIRAARQIVEAEAGREIVEPEILIPPSLIERASTRPG
nr:LacI family DNA-binding transcriptional regulator [Microbacterium halophytorum]